MKFIRETLLPCVRPLLSLAILGVALVGCRKQPTAGLGAQQGLHSVTLTWTASISSVVAYNVYRATKPGGPYVELTAIPASMTKFTDKFVEAGRTYFYVITAVDSRRVESPQSKEVSATVPTP
jgi:fibronectin type 3 domain-containing protein